MAIKYLQYLMIPMISALLCGGDHTLIEQGPRSLRHLISRSSTLSQIRLSYYYYNFTLNNQTLEDQFKGTLMKLVDSFFTTSLKVYPVQGNLILSSSSCLSSVKVPAEHRTVGVSNTDILIYITSNQLTNVSYVAFAGACETDQYGLGNVLAGSVVINVPNFSDNSMEEWLANIAHEISHLLGFSSGLFDRWRNSDGQLYSSDQIKKKVIVRGIEKSIIVTPNVITKARIAFNCSTLEGVELEDAGGSGTAGSHWDKRIMMNDYMTAYIPSDGIFTDISLALFKDTGWYDVNYTLAQSPYFGRNMGCDFFEKPCLINEQPINSSMWCGSEAKWGCDFFGLNKGGCKIDTYSYTLPPSMQYFSSSPYLGGGDQYMDYCPYNIPYTNGKCREGGSVATFRFTNSYEVIGQNSRCFESTLIKKPFKVPSLIYAACYEVLDCNDTTVNIKIENQIVACFYDGANITLSGWNGWFKCPSDKRICSDIPCRSFCYARGSCSGRGICNCFPGYGGDVCNVTCNTNCKQCSNTNNCTSCVSGFSLKTDRCCPSNCESCTLSSYCLACSEGYYMDQSKCQKCSSRCQLCTAANQCSKCEDLYYWVISRCCPQNCIECDSSSFCQNCQNMFYIDQNGICQPCPKGTYVSDNICKNCISHCDACSNGLTCNSCSSSYQKINQMCCPQLCVDCNQNSVCFTCLSEYYLIDSSSSIPCVRCREKCLKCKNSNSCDECIDSYALPDSAGDCFCIPGFFNSTETKRCTPCFSECLTCESKFKCLTCRTAGAIAKQDGSGCWCPEGFYNDSSCKPCNSECLTCDSPDSCFSCKDLNKVLNKTTGICDCKQGLFKIADGSCSLCFESCRICNEKQACLECRDQNADPLQECRCKSGYFIDGISCFPCPSTCKECTGLNNCTQCLNLNTFPLNNCKCDLESMEIDKGACVCRKGYYKYQQSQFFCLKCIRWLQKNDISVTLRNNYFEVDIFLNSSLDFSLSNLSFSLSTGSFQALGDTFEEYRLSSNHFLIQLGQNNSIFIQNLTFNLSLLFAVKTECGFDPQGQFEVAINKPFELPSPFAIITAPESFGYDCKLTQSFTVSGKLSLGGLGKDMTCSWAFQPKLDLSSSVLESCSIQVSAKLVSLISELNVTLIVMNYLGKTSSASVTIKIYKLVDISVDFFKNNTCSPSKKCLVFIDRITRCTEFQSLTYEWTLMNKTSENLGYFLKPADDPFLVIYPRTLRPGDWVFKMTVKQDGTVIENFTFDLKVLPEKPIIFLNKSPGSVSILYDFQLDASKSWDPNLFSLETGVVCRWKCFYELALCDFPLEIQDCKIKVLQKYLKSRKITHIWLSVTSVLYKTSSETNYSVNLVDSIVPEVRIFDWKTKKMIKKLPYLSTTRLTVSVDSKILAEVKWYLNSIDISSDFFVDLVPIKHKLAPGSFYKLILGLHYEDFESLSFYEEFLVNSPPLFGTFRVSPATGKESFTEFSFLAKDWVDDEEDYPLQYFFSYESQLGSILLKSSQSNFFVTNLTFIGSPSAATCQVSDSLGDFTESKTEIKIQKMLDSDIQNYRKQNEIIEPPTNIPLIISNLLGLTINSEFYRTGQYSDPDEDTLDNYQETFEFCLSNIKKFVKFSEPTDSFIDLVLNMLLSLTSNPNLKTNSNFELLFPVIIEFLSKVSSIGLELNSGEDVLKILENISEMNDKLVTKETDKLFQLSEIIEEVNLVVLKRMKDRQEKTISSKQIFGRLFAVESQNFNGFQYGNSDFSVHLPSTAVDLNDEQGILLGFMTTHLKLTPIVNSSHELVSLSFYNVTSSRKKETNLNQSLISIEIPVNYSYANNNYGKCCFLNATLYWDSFGCELKSLEEKSVICVCNHLSTFAFVSETYVKKKDSESHRNNEFTVETFKFPGFLLCLSLFVLYNILLIRIRVMKNGDPSSETNYIDKSEIKLEEIKEDLHDEKIEERKEKQHKNTEIATDRVFKYQKIKAGKKSEALEIIEDQDEFKGGELIIDIPEENAKHIENKINVGDSPLKSEPKYSSYFILNQFHTVYILITAKKYKNHAYLLTRSFFLFIVLVLFDSLYYDYSYRSTSVNDFEDFLEKNLIPFNVVTVLFSAAVALSIRILLFFLLAIGFNEKLKTLKYLVLSILFVLAFVYFWYLISCFSNGFTRFINKVWVVCAISSIFLEIVLFDPLSHLFASLVKRIYGLLMTKERKKV